MFAAWLALAVVAGAPPPEESVVRIQVHSARYDPQAPWRVLPVESGTGSGFLIGKGRVVTNAHVIRDARQVLVKRHHLAKPFPAKVVGIGDDCDLAVLEIADPEFHKGLSPLEIGGLPKARSQVTTYGFPVGGQEVSSTKGIVSRVEMRNYVHTDWDAHIAVQTDAAINPGNSGGPVIQDGRVVGVAFQGSPGLQNVGFFIPSPVLKHFLDDLGDGKYDGFPDVGVRTLDLQSPAYRKERRLPANKSGVVVEAIGAGGTAEGVLATGDVLTAIDGQKLDDDGNIALGDARVHFHHAMDMKQIGQEIPLEVWRDGKPLVVKAKARRIAHGDRYRNRYGAQPRYLVYAGLVFMLLDRQYLKTFGEDWPWTAPRDMIWNHFYREWERPETAAQDEVVIAKVLQHPVNSQLSVPGGSLVEKLGGVEVHSLEDVMKAISLAHTNNERFLRLELGSHQIESLEIKEADAAHAVILKTYGINKDRVL